MLRFMAITGGNMEMVRVQALERKAVELSDVCGKLFVLLKHEVEVYKGLRKSS